MVQVKTVVDEDVDSDFHVIPGYNLELHDVVL